MNNINKIVIELLKKRGIIDEEEILEFLSSSPKKTYDPFLLKDMREGVDLILSSIKENKKICIYGDYDADGITSTTLILEVLSHLTDNLDYYIPSRIEEGYGLNKEALKVIKDRGTNLVITVDCGSVSYNEVEYAKEIGLDIIVTDHHSIKDQKADCILINPKQLDCDYPFKYLAGCGVAFKLAQAICQLTELPKSVLAGVLDVAGIGTIGDIVPLIDENRTLAKFGIRAINTGARPGLRLLASKISLKPGKVNSDNVAYGIVPHLNASGRMLDAKIAVELLRRDREEENSEHVSSLLWANSLRKTVQEETVEKCIKAIDDELLDELFLLLLIEDAHEGIAGIAAGKIKDRYNRPAVILTPSGEFIKGTGRSIGKIDLYALLSEQKPLFEKFGGHAGACGFLMKRENLDKLKKGITAFMEKRLAEDENIFDEEIVSDMNIEGKDITQSLAEELTYLGPFGSHNEKPIFEIVVREISSVQYMGNLNQHVKFIGITEDGSRIKCIFFSGAEEKRGLLKSGKAMKVFGFPEIQEWNQKSSIQFLVNDMMELER